MRRLSDRQEEGQRFRSKEGKGGGRGSGIADGKQGNFSPIYHLHCSFITSFVIVKPASRGHLVPRVGVPALVVTGGQRALRRRGAKGASYHVKLRLPL